jgi:hypothetical protein
MATIPVQAQMSTEQLLSALEEVPPHEFSTLVDRLVVLRAARREPHLDETETALFLEINQGMSTAAHRRFRDLVAKREAEIIAPEELAELIDLTDQREADNAHRMAALGALAKLRGVPVTDLMTTLGIAPAADG